MYEELKARLDDAWTTTLPREHIEFMVSCREAIERLERQLAERDQNAGMGVGPTPLIAAMRAFVTKKFGVEIEIPEELK